MILGTICARGGSKGVPHKNIRPLAGKPLIAYTIDCALASPILDKIIVSTDDGEIAHYAEERGVEVQLRPPELATDTASKWDVFRHIARYNYFDFLVDLDIGCPLREPQDIEAAVRKLRQGYDVVFTATESNRNPYFNMVERVGDYVHVCYINSGYTTRRQDAPKVYDLSPAVVAGERSTLFENDHWSQAGMGIVEIPRWRAWDIDTELDFWIVERMMERKPRR